jgi:hypothetical protein
MPKSNYWVSDGLAVGFGRRTVDDENPAVVRTSGVTKELILELDDLATQVFSNTNTVAAARLGRYANAPTLKNGSVVNKVTVVVKTAAAGASADLQLGFYTINALTGVLTVQDQDALLTTTDSAVGDLTPAGKVLVFGPTGNGASLGKAAVANGPVVVVATSEAAYSAGALQIIVEYTEPT